MAEIKTIYKGESVTFLFTFPETYNMERLSSHKVFVGETEFAGVKDGQTVKLQLKSSDTDRMIGTHKVVLWFVDTTLGLRKPYCGDLVVARTQAVGNTVSVSNISDIIIPIVISETAITVGDVLYNYVKGDPFTYEDFTPEQLEALKVKGDKGDPFLYSDFTPEQLEALKVKGDPFLYSDFTPEQIAEIQRPATDAATAVNEAETLRVTAETIRVENEQGRVTAEGTRQSNEIARENSEDDREDAEELRLSAEITRGQNEQARKDAEELRLSAEITRGQNEQARKDAEELRVTAEGIRQTNTSTAIQNAETATTGANNAASLANEKAGLANDAAILANEKAGLAATATTQANDARDGANSAAQSATNLVNSYATALNGKVNTTDIEQTRSQATNKVASSKLLNEELNLKLNKSTLAGRFGLLFNSSNFPNFNTTAKTLTIPIYTRLMCGQSVYTNTGTISGPKVIDLSAYSSGFVTFNPTSGEWLVRNYTDTSGTTENELIIATYGNYGQYVNMSSKYTVDGAYPITDNSIKTPKIENNAVTTDKINNAAVTSVKSTVSGRYSLLYHATTPPAFNTIAKTLTLAGGSRIITDKSVVFVVGIDANPNTARVIDLSAFQYGFITFNRVNGAWTVHNYTDTSGTTENELIIAVYSNYGAIVNMSGTYTIDGNKFGIDLSAFKNETEIKQLITQNASKINTDTIHPEYSYIDIPVLMATNGWSDFVIIGANLWVFKPSSDEDHINNNGLIMIFDMSDWSTVGTITHNFGHVNTCHYDKVNDNLIVGNLPGNAAYPAAIYIFYNISEWTVGSTLNFNTVDKTIINVIGKWIDSFNLAACWGENNFEYRNVVYISLNYNQRFAKLLLGMGTNQYEFGTYSASDSDKFNGTFKVLEESTYAQDFNSLKEVIQGSEFCKGEMFTANGDDCVKASKWRFNINGKINRTIIEFPFYNLSGSEVFACAEGICYNESTGEIIQGAIQAQSGSNRYYFIKYKI